MMTTSRHHPSHCTSVQKIALVEVGLSFLLPATPAYFWNDSGKYMAIAASQIFCMTIGVMNVLSTFIIIKRHCICSRDHTPETIKFLWYQTLAVAFLADRIGAVMHSQSTPFLVDIFLCHRQEFIAHRYPSRSFGSSVMSGMALIMAFGCKDIRICFTCSLLIFTHAYSTKS